MAWRDAGEPCKKFGRVPYTFWAFYHSGTAFNLPFYTRATLTTRLFSGRGCVQPGSLPPLPHLRREHCCCRKAWRSWAEPVHLPRGSVRLTGFRTWLILRAACLRRRCFVTERGTGYYLTFGTLCRCHVPSPLTATTPHNRYRYHRAARTATTTCARARTHTARAHRAARSVAGNDVFARRTFRHIPFTNPPPHLPPTGFPSRSPPTRY